MIISFRSIVLFLLVFIPILIVTLNGKLTNAPFKLFYMLVILVEGVRDEKKSENSETINEYTWSALYGLLLPLILLAVIDDDISVLDVVTKDVIIQTTVISTVIICGTPLKLRVNNHYKVWTFFRLLVMSMGLLSICIQSNISMLVCISVSHFGMIFIVRHLKLSPFEVAFFQSIHLTSLIVTHKSNLFTDRIDLNDINAVLKITTVIGSSLSLLAFSVCTLLNIVNWNFILYTTCIFCFLVHLYIKLSVLINTDFGLWMLSLLFKVCTLF